MSGPAGTARTREVPTLGSFRLLEPLGEGGMGIVYRALSIETGEPAAVKTIRVPRQSLFAAIRREIDALARISHPGVVRILEHGVTDGVPWYAMELVEGVSLRRVLGPPRLSRASASDAEVAPSGSSGWWTAWLGGAAAAGFTVQTATTGVVEAAEGMAGGGSSGGSLPPLRSAVTLARRLCGILSYLHGEGIVHRDLKPENILLREIEGDPEPLPILVDFGLAAGIAVESRDRLRLEGRPAGTIAYVSPEQLQGLPLDARSDLYSLGCILFELLTGRPPFVGMAAEVLCAHLDRQPRPPSIYRPGIPRGVDRLVLRLLTKEPRDRIGHADVAGAALGRLGGSGLPRWLRGPRPRAYLYRPRLVGRDGERATLRGYLDRLRAKGVGGMVLVGGESGVGKTRLALALVGNRAGEAIALNGLAILLHLQKRSEPAGQLYEQSLALHRQLGNPRGEAIGLTNLGTLFQESGQYERARGLYEEALAISREVRDRHVEGTTLAALANFYLAVERDSQRARLLDEQALAIHREVGNRRGEGMVLNSLGWLDENSGRLRDAQLHYEQAISISQQIGNPRDEALALTNLAGLHYKRGRLEQARLLYEQSLRISRRIGDEEGAAICLKGLAECCRPAANLDGEAHCAVPREI